MFNDAGSPSPPWPPGASPCACQAITSLPEVRMPPSLPHSQSVRETHSNVLSLWSPLLSLPKPPHPSLPTAVTPAPPSSPAPPSPRYLKVSLVPVPVPLTRLLLTTNKSKQGHVPPPPQPPSGLAFLPASPPPAGGCSSLSPPSASPQFLCYLLIFCTF